MIPVKRYCKLFFKLLVIILVLVYFAILLNKHKTSFTVVLDDYKPNRAMELKRPPWRVNSYLHSMDTHNTIALKDMIDFLVPYYSSYLGNMCPFKITKDAPSLQFNPVEVEDWLTYSKELAKSLRISEGGEWQPDNCTSRFLVAVIIPFQNREDNLHDFLSYMHPFLQSQNIHYKLYAIELDPKNVFNKGIIMNAGFIEAMKDQSFPCVIFNDIDTLPKSPNHIYACTPGPRFMVVSYGRPGSRLIKARFAHHGGAVALLSDHFRQVNGFSNKFILWGPEDIAFYHRIVGQSLPVVRFEPDISSFHSVPHKLSKRSNRKKSNGILMEQILRCEEGLNTTKYKIVRRVNEPLCTRIVISY